ncbi:MAG: hypothetical protein E7620_07165 [Ruminococcaceae bacterium]|nr:hypothetical protein [Oscillospiraceae bacterium]
MKAEQVTEAWRLYEVGKAYKRRTGLYETVRRNEKFYRGEQWQASDDGLPRPVFNLVRRITDFLIGSIAPGEPAIHYTDDRLPFLDVASVRDRVVEGISLLNKNAAYRWTQNRMGELTQRALLDAAISGDGIFYCWWDGSCDCGQPFCGDIKTDLISNTSFFPADPEKSDVQGQDYLLLSGRASVVSLRREAIEHGMSPTEAEKILPDTDVDASESFDAESDGKATYLLRFWREDGQVVFEKSTKTHLIRYSQTGLRYYPVACFHWYPVKNAFHGSSPISEMIPNQRYVNSAYAMVMKHMSDTAFSKVIYDKSRIPEWSNEVGEAIAALGGGNVADAVSVVGVGQLQDGYLDVIKNVLEDTKNMMGATESAVGEERANNTSAILALQNASRLALRQVEARLDRCLGELASIWADMLCTYSHPERLIPVREEGEVRAKRIDYRLLRNELIHATAETGRVDRFTPAATVSLLDHLLDRGHITLRQYLEHLPDGCLGDKNALLQSIGEKGDNE